MKVLLIISLMVSSAAFANGPIIKKTASGSMGRGGALDAQMESEQMKKATTTDEQKMEEIDREEEVLRSTEGERTDSMDTAPVPSSTPSTTPAPTAP